MKYTIQIYYTTGDSFKSYQETQNIELAWENLDIAKENLQRIKKHYQYYEAIHSYSYTSSKSPKEIKALEEGAKKEAWYHHGKPHYDFCIMMKLDNGTEHRYHTFWCGYFETLHSAEIVADPIEDHDMKITF